MKVRIKKGASVAQDHRYHTWPNAWWPDGEVKNVNLEFDAKPLDFRSDTLDLRAHGFGLLGVKDGYGCGSLFVDYEDVEPVTMKDAKTMISELRAQLRKHAEAADKIRKAVNG